MRLSEIPRQKKMLYAPFLNVLLHCLAFFFFFLTSEKYFNRDRETEVQPLHNLFCLLLGLPSLLISHVSFQP